MNSKIFHMFTLPSTSLYWLMRSSISTSVGFIPMDLRTFPNSRTSTYPSQSLSKRLKISLISGNSKDHYEQDLMGENNYRRENTKIIREFRDRRFSVLEEILVSTNADWWDNLIPLYIECLFISSANYLLLILLVSNIWTL